VSFVTTIAGSVSAFDADAQLSYISALAGSIGVPTSNIRLVVSAASVRLEAIIWANDAKAAEAIVDSITSLAGDATSASALLGVAILSVESPVAHVSMVILSPPSPSLPPDASSMLPPEEDDGGSQTAALSGLGLLGLPPALLLLLLLLRHGLRFRSRDTLRLRRAVTAPEACERDGKPGASQSVQSNGKDTPLRRAIKEVVDMLGATEGAQGVRPKATILLAAEAFDEAGKRRAAAAQQTTELPAAVRLPAPVSPRSAFAVAVDGGASPALRKMRRYGRDTPVCMARGRASSEQSEETSPNVIQYI
jgi:hypothetical protein